MGLVTYPAPHFSNSRSQVVTHALIIRFFCVHDLYKLLSGSFGRMRIISGVCRLGWHYRLPLEKDGAKAAGKPAKPSILMMRSSFASTRPTITCFSFIYPQLFFYIGCLKIDTATVHTIEEYRSELPITASRPVHGLCFIPII